MAGSFTDALENNLLDVVFSGGTLVSGNITVGLYTTIPTDSSNGSTGEVSGVNYARQTVSTSGGWTASSGGAISNVADIVFPTDGAGGWGTVRAVGIFKGTTFIAYADVTEKTVAENDTVTIKAGDLDITLS